MNTMQKFWDEDTIRWMKDASEAASYNRELAAYIGRQLPAGSHVCDAGCGLGYLSLELSRYAARVTAVDISQDALEVLRENCAARGISNVSLRCGDIEQLEPETPYDAMAFCLFGGGDDALRIAAAQCRGDVFMVLRNYSSHRFSVNQHRMEYTVCRNVRDLLERLHVPYQYEERALDLGQPFRSMEDARRFFIRYSRDDERAISDAFLLSRVQPTGKNDFPYYMPHKREVGILRLRAADIPGTMLSGGDRGNP